MEVQQIYREKKKKLRRLNQNMKSVVWERILYTYISLLLAWFTSGGGEISHAQGRRLVLPRKRDPTLFGSSDAPALLAPATTSLLTTR